MQLLKLLALSASTLEWGESNQDVQVGLDTGVWCSGHLLKRSHPYHPPASAILVCRDVRVVAFTSQLTVYSS